MEELPVDFLQIRPGLTLAVRGADDRFQPPDQIGITAAARVMRMPWYIAVQSDSAATNIEMLVALTSGVRETVSLFISHHPGTLTTVAKSLSAIPCNANRRAELHRLDCR